MVAINRIVDEVVVRGVAEGVTETTATTNKLADAVDKVAVAQERQERRTLSVAKALESFAAKNDAAFRMQQQLERAQTLLNRAVEQGLSGTAAYERALAGLATQQARLVALNAQAAVSMQRVADAQRVLTRIEGVTGVRVDFGTSGRAQDVVAYGAELDRLRARYSPLFAAQQQYRTSLQDINDAAKVGAINEKERTDAIQRTKTAFVQQVTAIRGAAAANDAFSRSQGVANHHINNLIAQLSDVGISLQGGQSPFLVLTQQGSQILPILSETGVGGALGAIRDRLLGLITPARLVGGTILAAFVASAAATYGYEKSQRDAQLSLLGLGQGAGVTKDRLSALAEEGARAADISVASAKEIEKAFVRTGEIQGDVFVKGVVAVKNYATATGKELPEVAQFVADALASLGEGGYERLAKAAGTFGVGLDRNVKDLIAAGKETEAQILVVDRLAQAYRRTETATDSINAALAKLTRGYEEMWKGLGRVVRGDKLPLEEQLQRVEAVLGNRRAIGMDTADLDKRRSDIVRGLEEMGRAAKQKAEEIRASITAVESQAIRSAVPQTVALDQIQKLRAEANRLVNAREASGDTRSPDYAAAKKALEAYTKAEADYAAAGGPANMERYKAAELTRANTQALQATTPLEKAAAAAAVARAELIGAVVDRTERQQRAQDAYRRSLAESQKASDDQSRAMSDETRTANELAEATTRNAKSTALLTAERRVDAAINAGTINAADRNKKIQEDLQSQLAGVNRQTAERVRTQREATEAQADLNRRVELGAVASEQAQRLLPGEIERRKLLTEIDAASGDQKAALTRRYEELKAAQESQLAVEDRQRVVSASEDEDRRIAYLKKEIDLIGASTQERQRQLAMFQAEQEMKRRGVNTDDPVVRAYINKVGFRADLESTKSEYERLAQDVAQIVSGIFDDLFTQTTKGVSGIVDGISRGLTRLSSRFLEQNLIAPMLGGQAGTATGLSGLDFGDMRKAVEKGFSDGFDLNFGPLLQPQKNKDGRSMGFASSPLGSGLLVAASGASLGYQSQSPLMGALGGAVSGYAMGNIPGALIGGAAGLLGGIFGKDAAKEAKKKAVIQAQAQYQQQKPAIDQLRAGLRGEATGGVEGSILAMNAQVQQAAQEAAKAGDTATVQALAKEYAIFVDRARAAFTRTFEGTMADLYAGLGPSGPFTQAAAAVVQLGESLKSFVKDSEATGNTTRARAAAQEAALASLDAPKPLSETQTRLREIAGTAAGLAGVLQDLGMSADQAAAAIRDRTAKAIDALRDSFSDDLTRKINAASGKDYLSSLADLAKERETMLADAASLGTDAGRVAEYVRLAAQKIVDDAGLTGEAFSALSDQFPDLTSGVHAFTEALDTAAAKAAAAARALGYQDRLFAATNDTSTLAGQLAAFDRKAAQERQAEIEAGGQALADLERAHYAERAKIEQDYYEQVAETQRQALEQARQAYDTFARSIRSYLDNLRAGSSSPLSPQARLAAAQSQYNAQLALAQGGDRTALDAITGYATDLLETAKAMYASSSGFQAIYNQVTGQLGALPSQVSPEQFIVDGVTKSIALMQSDLRAAVQANSPSLIASALLPQFDALTATTGGLLSQAQFVAGLGPLATREQQAAALAVFQSIDADGDSQISKLELVRAQLLAATQANSPGAIATALNGSFAILTEATNGRLTAAQLVGALGPLATKADQDAALAVFRAIDADGDGMLSALEVLRTTLKAAIDAGNAQATASALAPQFGTLTSATNGLLSLSQFQSAIGPLATSAEQQAARSIFAAIDADGDSQISKLELIRAQAGATADYTAATAYYTGTALPAIGNAASYASSTAANTGSALSLLDASNAIAGQQKAVLDAVASLTSQTKTSVDAGNSIAAATRDLTNGIGAYTAATRDNVASGNSILGAINSLSGLQRDQLDALNRQFAASNLNAPNGQKLQNNMVDALNKIVFNTAVNIVDNGKGSAYFLASGGWVRGPGTGTSDSIPAMLSNGEFVVTAAAARANARLLEAMNENAGGPIRMEVPAPVPLPVAMPIPAAVGGGPDLGALVAEVRALRAEVRAQGEVIARMTKAAGDQVAARVEDVGDKVDEGNADRRRGQKNGMVLAGRGSLVA